MQKISQCQTCASFLEHGCRPVVQAHPNAKVLIIGQAPGLKVHQSGIPFNDASGDRLRQWMGIDKETFYHPEKLAIMPMGFCYPGKGKSGDLAPRKECAPQWHQALLEQLPNIEFILLIGQYAQQYYLNDKPNTLTETVQAWQQWAPKFIPLPHPSPRNNIWLKKNPWFEQDVIPYLQQQVHQYLK
ncbi:IclR family transcriptional regulator [Vibrio rumoiensis 1S-45]|uniref:IclR family transcriptional regulator n=2 Tax=Vibrio rumoiensis TaxID=76258 RepID=A0A1E5E6J9_9VIBR|nr:uracil-DNA glycosylase family protein [Vibrio rumoiensis]OEF29494.1 IclR family transcriptional regulator [Vibrio rumoiensis 1S-45]